MKRTLKTIALCGVIGLAAASCQKENIIENTAVVARTCDTRTVLYTVNNVEYRLTLDGEEAMRAFLQYMAALAEEGYYVTFRYEDSASTIAASKDTITFSTQDKATAVSWCEQMINEGYEVSMYYDKDTGTYHCTATK